MVNLSRPKQLWHHAHTYYKKTANFQSLPYVIQQFYPLSATKAANFQSSTIKTTTSKQAKKQTKKQKKVTQVQRQRLTYSSRSCLHSAAYRGRPMPPPTPSQSRRRTNRAPTQQAINTTKYREKKCTKIETKREVDEESRVPCSRRLERRRGRWVDGVEGLRTAGSDGRRCRATQSVRRNSPTKIGFCILPGVEKEKTSYGPRFRPIHTLGPALILWAIFK